jgi:hypothetical protein
MRHFLSHVKKFRIYSPIYFNASDVSNWNLTCEIIRLKLPCVWTGDSLAGLQICSRIRIILGSWIRIRIRVIRGIWTLTLESYWLKMKPWRVYRLLFADSNHFDEEQDTETVPIRTKGKIRIRIRITVKIRNAIRIKLLQILTKVF